MDYKHKKYKKYKKKNNQPLLNCSICLRKIGKKTKKKLDCGHIYHWRCIDKWTKINNNCPLCRDIQCKECKDKDEEKVADGDFMISPDDLIEFMIEIETGQGYLSDPF